MPPLRFDEARDTRFVSVDCGALDNGAAARLLPGFAPAPLALRLRETVAWWLQEQQLGFELSQQAEPRAEHGSSSGAKRSRILAAAAATAAEAEAEGAEAAAAASASTEAAGIEPEGFRFNFAGNAAEA